MPEHGSILLCKTEYGNIDIQTNSTVTERMFSFFLTLAVQYYDGLGCNPISRKNTQLSRSLKGESVAEANKIQTLLIIRMYSGDLCHKR